MAVAKLDVIEQYLDNSGLLLAGGLIYTYAGGTTTPLASYADATGLIANSNPVVLDRPAGPICGSRSGPPTRSSSRPRPASPCTRLTPSWRRT
jgi:hypothetical protein